MKANRWAAIAMLLSATAASAQSAPAAPAPGSALALTFRTEPDYPRQALRDGISGFVDLEVTVDPDGTVRKARIVKAEPPDVFEAAAVRAIMKWKFKPRIVDGKPVEAVGMQRIAFDIEPMAEADRRVACEKSRPPRKPGSMSNRVYRRMEKAVDTVQKQDYAAAENQLTALLTENLEAYERAIALQALAHVQAMQNKNPQAIAGYEQALATETLPWKVDDQMRFGVAQLHGAQGNIAEAVRLLDLHLKEACEPNHRAAELRAALAARLPAP